MEWIVVLAWCILTAFVWTYKKEGEILNKQHRVFMRDLRNRTRR